MQNQALTLQEKLNHFSNIEETLSKTIIVAQEAADEVQSNAKKEAQLIVKEAEKNADRIINESLSKSRKVALEVEELKKQASIYRARFRTLGGSAAGAAQPRTAGTRSTDASERA